MQSTDLRNVLFTGSSGRQSTFDLSIPENYNGQLIIFLHGFMGFKDWGCWNLMEKAFSEKGYAFLKYNGSHNGTSPENPMDFVDLDAFGRNTYTKEVEDLEAILLEVANRIMELPEITLIGHSRGGGIALLFSRDARISRIISLAGISSIAQRFPKGVELDQWKTDQVRFVHNSRTGQDLPLLYSQFEDFQANRKRLNIEYYCRTSSKPTLIIHGDQDESVAIKEGEELADWTNTELVRIQEAGHTFGATHPWNSDTLPEELNQALNACFRFLEHPIDPEQNHNISSIVELIKLAKVDNEFIQTEFEFIHKLALMMGMRTDDFKELFERYIAFSPSPLEFDRIVQFQRLILLMNIDKKVTPQEVEYVHTLAIRMGLHVEATNAILRFYIENPGKLMPPEQLLRLFKVHHN